MDIRPTTKADIAAVDALLAHSYPALLKADYLASVLVTALPIISRARPELVTCGTYYGAFENGILRGAGGWTLGAPSGGRRRNRVGHIRHVVTDPDHIRRGIGTRLMVHTLQVARTYGVTRMMCQATRTAVPFYRSVGFEVLRDILVPLRPGIDFPAVEMTSLLADGS
ncbi:GNAT family N-acetyltransferase [Litoreibacter roseus]|uniref:N-acetyltransferase n=1 Tax=Litoreibacter roseus TaxID=2601869 RepID=A0A6N6JJK1_9RHOB|nr:GNAT family N-acetyltransferase [Litoreibacter roseus]GFE65619.1 N-acetyltransferase [Litoreibacter roseus]